MCAPLFSDQVTLASFVAFWEDALDGEHADTIQPVLRKLLDVARRLGRGVAVSSVSPSPSLSPVKARQDQTVLTALQDKLTRAEMELATLRKAANPGHLKQLTSSLKQTERELKLATQRLAEHDRLAAEAALLERGLSEERNVARLQKALAEVTAQRNALQAGGQKPGVPGLGDAKRPGSAGARDDATQLRLLQKEAEAMKAELQETQSALTESRRAATRSSDIQEAAKKAAVFDAEADLQRRRALRRVYRTLNHSGCVVGRAELEALRLAQVEVVRGKLSDADTRKVREEMRAVSVDRSGELLELEFVHHLSVALPRPQDEFRICVEALTQGARKLAAAHQEQKEEPEAEDTGKAVEYTGDLFFMTSPEAGSPGTGRLADLESRLVLAEDARVTAEESAQRWQKEAQALQERLTAGRKQGKEQEGSAKQPVARGRTLGLKGELELERLEETSRAAQAAKNSLERQVTALQSKLEEVTDEARRGAAERDSLVAKLEAAQAEFGVLRDQTDITLVKKEEQLLRLEKKVTELEAGEAQSGRGNDRRRGSDVALAAREGALLAITEECREIKLKWERSAADCESLLRQVGEVTAERAALEGMVAEMQRQLDAHQMASSPAKSSPAQVRSRDEDLAAEIRSMSAQNKHTRQHRNRNRQAGELSGTVDGSPDKAAAATIRQLTAELATKEREADHSARQLDRLQVKLSEARVELSGAKIEVSTLQEQLLRCSSSDGGAASPDSPGELAAAKAEIMALRAQQTPKSSSPRASKSPVDTPGERAVSPMGSCSPECTAARAELEEALAQERARVSELTSQMQTLHAKVEELEVENEPA